VGRQEFDQNNFSNFYTHLISKTNEDRQNVGSEEENNKRSSSSAEYKNREMVSDENKINFTNIDFSNLEDILVSL